MQNQYLIVIELPPAVPVKKCWRNISVPYRRNRFHHNHEANPLATSGVCLDMKSELIKHRANEFEHLTVQSNFPLNDRALPTIGRGRGPWGNWRIKTLKRYALIRDLTIKLTSQEIHNAIKRGTNETYWNKDDSIWSENTTQADRKTLVNTSVSSNCNSGLFRSRKLLNDLSTLLSQELEKKCVQYH